MSEFIDEQTQRILKNIPELDDVTRLTMKDLPYIRMAMINVSAHWYNIGIHFGLSTNTMDKFRSRNRQDSDKCLTCVIVEWLKNFREKHGVPTWKKVIIAVSSRVGGDNPAEACRIAKNYKNYSLENSFKSLEEVDNRSLGSDSIPMVVASLMDGVADRWMSIGLLLGIPYKLIQVFQMEDTLEESIIKMVDAWVKKQYDTNTFGEPSWRKLVEAVAARSGGSHHRLASTIASNHPLSYSTAGLQPLASEQQIPQFEDTPAAMATSSHKLAPDILTEEDLVSLMNLLRPVAHKWETLCVQLGVSMGDIKNIGANPMKFSGAPLTFLQDGLYVWLQNSPGPKRSISALCDVLKGPVISEVTLGVEVEKHLKGAKGLPL